MNACDGCDGETASITSRVNRLFPYTVMLRAKGKRPRKRAGNRINPILMLNMLNPHSGISHDVLLCKFE